MRRSRRLGLYGLRAHQRRRIELLCSLRAARSQRDATSVAALRPPRLATEFRQVTFMYVDLVGSTELSGMLEPEAYSDLIVRYRDAVGPRISANGGTIARFTGDGILAYFGYPKAAAKPTRRALSMPALEAVEALHARAAAMPDGTQAPLEARISVHTGMTVVGDLEGAGVVEVNAAVGHAANVAARIQAAAAPGRVAISDVTWRLVEPHFHTRPMGLMSLKGVSHPMQLHEVVAQTNVSSGIASTATSRCGHPRARGRTSRAPREMAPGNAFARQRHRDQWRGRHRKVAPRA